MILAPALLSVSLHTATVANLEVAAWRDLLEWSSARKRERVRKPPRSRPKPEPKPEPGEVSPRRVTTIPIDVCTIIFSFEEMWRCRVNH